MARLIMAFGAALLVTVSAATVGSADTETVVEVQRVKPKKAKHPTLRFLKENRTFFRTRLDDLRMREALREADAEGIDPRLLRFQELLDEIHAAQDSAYAGDERTRRRELLQSVQDLAELEREMDRMERLLDEQAGRLSQLAEDFVGEQRTTLIVLVTGVPRKGSPRTVIMQTDEGDSSRVRLSATERESLASGGTAELLHELVEPRRQRLAFSFEGEGWAPGLPYEIVVEPQRDRLTFLELDLEAVDPERPERSLAARIWTR
jgi:hypothetical protein